MESTLAVLIVLMVAGFAAFSGLGMLWGAGAASAKEGSAGGVNVGKIIFIFVVVSFLAMWLGAPGTDQQIADATNAIWGNLVRGLTPLVLILVQVGFILALAYGVFLIIRRHLRR